ncbi:MAG: ABC transporter ATP-binding protein [Myxococcales bacterium]|nr:ABC transporter ATP-binding protein [Myxococcales bacterium]
MNGHAIESRGLTRRFGDFIAVKEVSFDVERGEIFGYLGANGAGKSTTIRMLCGLLAPSAGDARVADHDVASEPEAVKRAIGYMSQRFSLYMDLTVAENLDFFGGAYGLGRRALRRRVDELLERVDLTAQRDVRTGDLPGGLRQRLALVSALLHEPRIVFLDEPTAGVAPAARRTFWRLIRELAADGTTVFVTTHYMDEAEYCHRIGLMVDGDLRALDTPAALKATHVPGELYALHVGDGEDAGEHRAGGALAELLAKLAAAPGVIDAQPFGAAAHVRIDPARTSFEALRAAATAAAGGHPIELSRIAPTLEDVFLAVVEGGHGDGDASAKGSES